MCVLVITETIFTCIYVYSALGAEHGSDKVRTVANSSQHLTNHARLSRRRGLL